MHCLFRIDTEIIYMRYEMLHSPKEMSRGYHDHPKHSFFYCLFAVSLTPLLPNWEAQTIPYSCAILFIKEVIMYLMKMLSDFESFHIVMFFVILEKAALMNPCCMSNVPKYCSFCEKIMCNICQRVCENCDNEFCHLCSILQ